MTFHFESPSPSTKKFFGVSLIESGPLTNPTKNQQQTLVVVHVYFNTTVQHKITFKNIAQPQ